MTGHSDQPPVTTSAATVGPLMALMQVQAAMEGSQLCALGFHAWMPWLPIRVPDGLPTDPISRYETYCVRCRHPEQFDV